MRGTSAGIGTFLRRAGSSCPTLRGPPHGAAPTGCTEQIQRSRKGKAHKRRDMGKERPPDLTGTSGSGRRTEWPQVHARAEQIQTVFQTCAPGSGPLPRGSLGTFHPWKVPRPGAKYPPPAGRHMGRPLRDMMNGCLRCRGGPMWPPAVPSDPPKTIKLRS